MIALQRELCDGEHFLTSNASRAMATTPYILILESGLSVFLLCIVFRLSQNAILIFRGLKLSRRHTFCQLNATLGKKFLDYYYFFIFLKFSRKRVSELFLCLFFSNLTIYRFLIHLSSLVFQSFLQSYVPYPACQSFYLIFF